MTTATLPRARNFIENGLGVLTGPHGERWLVSLEDFDHVAVVLWHDNGDGYARTSMATHEVYLHRVLMPGVKTVDHIDRNPRNCVRSNLRDGTGINQLNSPKRTGTRSHFRGVSPMRDKWQARVSVNYQRHYLGTFDDEESAAKAVREFASQHGRLDFYR